MKKTHIVGIIIIAIAMLSMISLLGNSSTYADFKEAKGSDPEEEVHVAGTLVLSKPIVYDPVKDPNSFSFYMKDKSGEEMHVILKKIKPQDFERSEQLVVIGSVQGNSFVAKDVLMKCPSKYNNGQEQAL
ncbi:MAG: cytochrome c maturation protein CcmE [Bacteroidia bacterium]|nr:cytochrome c maturation protein CcmE [Bacteroidia bacterium]